MKNLIQQIIDNENVESLLQTISNRLFRSGPTSLSDLEALTYIKYYHPLLFQQYEASILMSMGLFYKNVKSQSLHDIVFEIYKESIKTKFAQNYTPVQANMINHIHQNRYFSFSSPTSTGKSYVFRHIIRRYQNDVIIIVPSRALINEYNILLESLVEEKDTLILTHIDFINTRHVKRHIFIITPERTRDLFKYKDRMNVDIILFDEAQLSDDASVRGLYYDSVIRRCVSQFKTAKLVFAYPFIDNPEAQYTKNKITYASEDYYMYSQRNVGQIFFCYDKSKNFCHFSLDVTRSPRKVKIQFDPVKEVLNNGGSLLVYCSKSSIYKHTIFNFFEQYIALCPSITDIEALTLIDKFRNYIGASDSVEDGHYSRMVDYLKRGIVIHHGSLPLTARYIIEEFTKKRFCRICFATSTLEQGINMPFDMVWIHKFEPSKPLNVKNIIGRAGRSTNQPVFDYGQIVIKEESLSKLRSIITNKTTLSPVSQLDISTDANDDYKEYKEAIKNNEFDEEYNLTIKELERISNDEVRVAISHILDLLFPQGEIQLPPQGSFLNISNPLYSSFETVYSAYLNRMLSPAEKNIFLTVIMILLWKIEGRSFNQIVWFRYSFAAQLFEKRALEKELSSTTIPHIKQLLRHRINNLPANRLTMYQTIPNKKIQDLSLTHNLLATQVDYDSVVVDTYDYLDKLIGFRLGDAIYAAFYNYFLSTRDERANKMCNYIRFGTNDAKEILLLRYGFEFEDFAWLKDCVTQINEEEIVFGDIDHLSEEQFNKIKKFRR